ncbi:hypothetical protein MJD09_10640, partial [bacterium]|nr:hypothetical protein [bacterium]
NPRLAVAKKLRSMVLTYSEDRYRNGTNYREYRAARRSGLNADKLDTWIVADEIRKSWGKISQKAFAAHWSLVEAITDQRVDSLAFFPSADVSEERVRQVAANSLYNDLKRSLALNPI